LGAQAQTTQEETPTGLPTQDLKTTVIPRQQLRALSQDDDVLRALVQTIVQEALVRHPERAHRGRRSGSPGSKPRTRVGTLELRVPQARGAGSLPGCPRVNNAVKRRCCSA
jgi:hypothetical protein